MASKKRPSSDQVKGLLLEGNFGATEGALPMTDPIATTQMVLTLSDIKPYDQNPRRDPNPRYDDIKSSIRSKKQLNNNFNVTRRPGDDVFMVEAGGNTRLQILNELYQETGDEAFNKVHCLFVPWKSESAVLTAHLIENEMRGDMSLIDKAYAAQDLKRMLEDEMGRILSDREFTRVAEEIGYKISKTLLGRFKYAIELDQMIPQVMRSGLGGQKIDQIKKVERAYRQYCEDKTNQFEAAFMAVMAESDDGDYWDFEEVRQELDERLSALTGVRENLLRIEVDAIIFNTEGDRKLHAEPPTRDVEPVQPAIPQQTTDSGSTIEPVQEPSAFDEDDVPGGELAGDEAGVATQLNEIVRESGTKRKEQAEKEESEAASANQLKPVQHLKMLRQKNYDLACEFARLVDIDDAVMPIDDGLGFIMDIPTESLTSYSNKRSGPETLRRYFTWWMLLSVAEQHVSRDHHFIWTHLRSWKLLREQADQNESQSWLGVKPEMNVLMCEYLHNKKLINDQTFTKLFRMLESCRTLRDTFPVHEIWSLPVHETELSRYMEKYDD